MLADTDRVSISRFFTDSEEKKVLQETDFLKFLVWFMEILWWKFKESFLQLYFLFLDFVVFPTNLLKIYLVKYQ